MGLAVVGERRPVRADELCGVEDPLARALRVPVEDGESVPGGDLTDGQGGRPVGGSASRGTSAPIA